jgi:hypothetical protein
MYFAVQASNPAVVSGPAKGVRSMASAIARIFPGATEEAIMYWNALPVRMNYRYDVSVMIDDVQGMLAKLLSERAGEHRVFWGSQTFMAEWRLGWGDGQLRITSDWKHVAGSYVDALNATAVLEIGHDNFMWEWKALLDRTLKAIDASGIAIDEADQVAAMRSIEAAIPRFGILYQAT